MLISLYVKSIDHHWVGLSLAELATQPVSYLQAWLLTIKTLRKQEQIRLEGG